MLIRGREKFMRGREKFVHYSEDKLNYPGKAPNILIKMCGGFNEM
jgi:hypothetical protein